MTPIDQATTIEVIRRGLRTTPQLLEGARTTLFMGALVAAGQVTTPIVIQQAIDRGGLASGQVDFGVVWRLAITGIIVFLCTVALSSFARMRLVRRAEASLESLRNQAFGHVHRMSHADHTEQSTGVLIGRVTSDVDALSRFIDWGFFVWAVEPIVVVGVFIAMAWYSWPLALLAIVLFLPVARLLRWMQTRMAQAHDLRRTAIGELLGAYNEALIGAEVVRAYALEERTADRIDAASQNRYRAGLRANWYMSSVFVIGDLIAAVMMAVLVLVGWTSREALGLSAGEMVGLLVLTTILQSPIAELGETLNNAQQAVAGWRKVLGLLETPVEDLEPESGVDLPSGPLGIVAESVSFAYRDGVPVLESVDVEIAAGSRVAIVGATGSGKSTFARLLARLADPTAGTVHLGGHDLRAVSADTRRAGVRFVPQDGFLFDATIRDNIAFGRVGATDEDIDRAIEVLGLRPWIARLSAGLATPVGERGSALSVGERQLVSFARAAVADPGLLILDEATSSVDPQTDLILTRALDRLSEGRTVISIAHRLSTAEAADQILVFDEGRIVEDGTHEELLASSDGVYAELHEHWVRATDEVG